MPDTVSEPHKRSFFHGGGEGAVGQIKSGNRDTQTDWEKSNERQSREKRKGRSGVPRDRREKRESEGKRHRYSLEVGMGNVGSRVGRCGCSRHQG